MDDSYDETEDKAEETAAAETPAPTAVPSVTATPAVTAAPAATPTPTPESEYEEDVIIELTDGSDIGIGFFFTDGDYIEFPELE